MRQSTKSLDVQERELWIEDMKGFLPIPRSSLQVCSGTSEEFLHNFLTAEGDLIGWTDVDRSESVSTIQSVIDSPKEKAESLDSVSELPSSCGQLQHLGKARPRRVKTRAPTRPMGRADLVEEDHDISEGVDTFFRPGSSTPTTPLISPDSENSVE
nr:uncharacterized protein LOC128704574 [Cherax quadricarinatus]